MFEIEPPRDTAALRRGLGKMQQEINESMAAFSDEAFFEPQGEHWAPSGHMRHLAKCIRPLAQAMKLPKMALRLRFGKSKKGSRSFEEVREHYQSALKSGEAQAGGYGPSSKVSDLPPNEWRAQIMRHFDEASEQLDGAFDSWSDRQLDSIQVEHPILGAMTVREMLYFTLYHNAHHARRVQERAAS